MLKETKKLAIDKEVEVEEYKIQSHFFPLPDSPYVCYHKDRYLLWPDLFSLLGIKPVELGRGLTTRQETYLLEHSEGYIGPDGWAATQCRVLGKPVVLVRDAFPEDLANELLEKTGREKINHKSLHIGTEYIQPQVDFVPDFPLFNHQLVPATSGINIRLDLCFNLEYAATAFYRKCSVITNQPIDPNFINRHKANINLIIYLLDEKHNEKFVDFIHKSGVRYMLISVLPEKYLSDLRVKYFDYNAPIQRELESIDFTEGMKFKTNRKMLLQGKFFSSEWHLSQLKIVQEEEVVTEQILKEPEFIKNLNHYYFYT